MTTTQSLTRSRTLGLAATVVAVAVVGASVTALAPAAHATTSAVGVRAAASTTQLHALADARPTAKVSGTYTRLASGRVNVAVRTSTGKVKVIFKTARSTTRSVKATARGGVAHVTLAKGSTKIRARALAGHGLRRSATKAITPSWFRTDIDRDGIRDWVYDGNQDGRYELYLWDNDRSSRFETVVLTTPSADGVFFDKNEDGYFETTGIDADKDGDIERMFHDANGDGYAEWQCVDRIGGDGKADTWINTQVTASSTSDRAANDMMVKHMVTMNQLRQLDPWSTGYIPYDPTPWILR